MKRFYKKLMTMRDICFLFLMLIIAKGYSQDYPVNLYKTTVDYKSNNLSETYKGIIVDEGKDYVTISKIKDSVNDKVIQYGLSAWAIRYYENDYYNLSYYNSMTYQNAFAKFHLTEGRYYVVVLNANFANKITQNYNSYNGISFSGSTVFSKLKKTWLTQEGFRKQIILIDTKLEDASLQNASGINLSPRKLKKFIKKNKLKVNKESFKSMSFEEVIELIKLVNSKDI
ncbi:MAG: hypothetical protein COA67_07930 [Lutibacter sp.]|nr:MAG: hypothetical protein COA67_07930 [Lutibacter sp.]